VRIAAPVGLWVTFARGVGSHISPPVAVDLSGCTGGGGVEWCDRITDRTRTDCVCLAGKLLSSGDVCAQGLVCSKSSIHIGMLQLGLI
jgi:hypothetical protein